MRLYKVRVLQLHTSEALWVGAVMDSSNGADPRLMQGHAAWSKQEMDDVIAYAKARGVCLLPHNEMRPNDPFWTDVLTRRFNSRAPFTCYVDEIDHRGKYEIHANLADDPRFWNFLKVVTQRSYDQFAKGWPGGRLPYYHIGPVYGEGGCNGKEAVKMLGFLREKNPEIKMMYWNGPGEADPDLSPHKQNVVVDFYSATWGGTPEGLLAAGYKLCNVSWRPLYVLPGSRLKALKQGRWIFDEFQLSRFGGEGPFGEPINARDCSKFQGRILGAMLATWDFGSPAQGEGHLEMLLPCLPFFAERIWNVRPWPYSQPGWRDVSAAAARLFPLLSAFARDERPSSPPGDTTATQGVRPCGVDVLWAESDNYPEYYRVYRSEADDPAKAQPISGRIPAAFLTQLNRFRDNEVPSGKIYHYWVRSVNPFGESPLGQGVKGWKGTVMKIPVAAESFDYAAGTALDGLHGGSGFKTPWKVVEFNAPLTIAAQGLTYSGLKTSGRALHVESTDADETNRRRPPHVRIERSLACPYAREGTQVWTSCLIRAERAAIGEMVVNIGRTNIGKGWGDEITVYTASSGCRMAAGKTYLIVVRYTFQKGNDLIHMWINPSLGTQPRNAEADVVTRSYHYPESDTLSIGMQPYGRGSYDIDEIRVGASYTEVVPAEKP